MGINKKLTKKVKSKKPQSAIKKVPRSSAKPEVKLRKKSISLTYIFLQTFLEITQLLLQGSNLEKLLSQVCEKLIQNRTFFHAWIGLYNHITKSFDIFAQAGLGKTFDLISEQIQAGSLPTCLSKTLKQNKIYVISDPLQSCPQRPLVLDQNYQSVCLPLWYRNHYYGTLVIAVSKTFTADKIKPALLQEIAAGIAATCYKFSLEQSQTENKAALSSSQEQIQNLFTTMVEGLAIFDVLRDHHGKAIDYVLRDANPAFTKHFRISISDAVGKKSSFFSSCGITPHLDTFLKVAETRAPVTFEDYYQNLDQYFRVSVFAPQKGSLIAIYSNISENKKLEFALSEKEERIRMALEAANQGFWEWQLKNQCIQISPSFFSMLGFTPPKDACLPFKHLEEMVSPQDKDAAFTTIMKHIQKISESFEVEVRIHNQMHAWQWFLIRGKVIERDRQNNPVRITGTYLNITERKQSEELHRFQREFALEYCNFSGLDEFLHKCITNVLTISSIDCGGIYILDENEGLQLVAHKGLSPEFIKESSHYAFDTPQTQLVMQGKAIYTHYAQLKFPKGSAHEQQLIKAFALIPIEYQKKVFGCINLASHTLNEMPEYLRRELETFSTYIGNIVLRIQAQNELTQSEERYHSIYDQSPIGIVLHSGDGQLINVNQACLNIFGVPSSDHIHMINLFENPLLSSKEKATLLNGEPVRKNNTFDFKQAGDLGIIKTGKFGKLHLEVHIIPLGKSADHPPTGFLSQIQDVTKRKESEEIVLKNEERMELAFWGAGTGFWDINIQTGEMFFNSQWIKMLDYDSAELVPHISTWQKLIHPEDLPLVMDNLNLHFDKKLSFFEAEYRMQTKTKTWKWFFDRGKVVEYDLQGKSLRIAGTHMDITETIQAKANLQEEKNRFESVIENAPQIASQGFNRKGIVCHWNKVCESLYGFKHNEIIGHHFREKLLPGKAGDEFAKVLEYIYTTGQAIPSKEWACQTKDGRKLWLYSSTFPIFDKGRVSEVFCMDVDITHRKTIEEALFSAKEKAEETNLELENAIENANNLARQAAIADAAKSQFLANMSHEIRTPLNSISGFAEMVLDTELSLEQRNSIETILHSTETLMTLINDILDLSKVEAGQIELEKLPIHLETLVYDICDMVRIKADKKTIEILCDFGTVPRHVLGDPTRLRQVLLNLLGNAVKFTSEGEIVTTLSLLAENENHIHIQFSIRDTGIGIPQNKLKSIFEPFTQADGSTARLFGGTGLGLAISYKLVCLMGGTLSVQTQVNQGSTFSFDLLFEKAPDPSIEQLSFDQHMHPQAMQVLLMDDNATALKISQSIITQLGMPCAIATSFDEGLKKLEASRFSVIIVTIDFPGLDPTKLREYASKHDPAHPAYTIAVSPIAPQNHYGQNQHSQFDGILVKPLRNISLIALIQSLVISDSQSTRQSPLVPPETVSVSARILLAEDNKANQEIMIKILKRMGHHIDVAADGHEVLAYTEKNKYDLIFMDMQMPKMGGLEATYILRRKKDATPIIALTANAMKGDRERCLTAGMNDYISKPIKRNAVLDVLQRYAGIKSISEVPETLRILLLGQNIPYIKRVYESLHQAFPMASCHITSSGVEAGVLAGSFFPNLIVMDLQTRDLDTYAMIHYLKSENRYAQTKIIVYNAQAMDKIHIQTLRTMGIAVLLPPKVPVSKFLSTTKQLLTNAFAFHPAEAEVDLSLVEAISQELGISSKDYFDILVIFLRNTPNKIHYLKSAIDEENGSEASDVAHSIKSSALALRLHTVADPASRLEKLVSNSNFSDTDTLFTTLQNAFEAVRLTLIPPDQNKTNEGSSN